MKKLTEYPTTPVRMHLGSNVDTLIEREYLIPAPVAEAHDKRREAADAVIEAAKHIEEMMHKGMELKVADAEDYDLRDALTAYKEATDEHS